MVSSEPQPDLRVRLLLVGLIALCAAVPLLMAPTEPPSLIKSLVLVTVVAFGVLAWAAHPSSVRLGLLEVALAINLLIWIASLAASDHPAEGTQLLAERAAGVGLLLLIVTALRTRRDLIVIVAVLVAATAVMSVYGLLQLARLDPFHHTSGLVGHFRVSSTTDHPTTFATVLAAILPLNIAAFHLLPRRARTWRLLALALLLNLAALAATLCRAGWAAAGLALLVGFIASGVSWTRRTLVGVLIVIAIAGASVWIVSRQRLLDTGERERLLSSGASTEKRLLLYRAAGRMAATAPLLGKGLGTFALHLPEVRTRELARYYPRNDYQLEHAASEPLEILAESGALGLGGWLLLVTIFIARPLRARRRVADPALRHLLAGCAAGSVGLVAHSLVEISLRNQPPGFLFWMLPALALAAERIGASEPAAVRSVRVEGWPARLAIAATLSLGTGLALAVTLSGFIAGLHGQRSWRALQEGRLVEAEREGRTALAAWAGHLAARYRRAYALWGLGRAAEAEAEYREVARRSPAYYDVNRNLAQVLFDEGKTLEAQRSIERAMRLNPFHAPSHDLAVRIYLRLGRGDHAEQVAEQIRRDAPDAAEAHLALARVRLWQGRVDESRASLEEAGRREGRSKEIRHLLRQIDLRPPPASRPQDPR